MMESIIKPKRPTGPGWNRSVPVANGTLGADITAGVPANARWKFKAFTGSLISSAAIANRDVSISMAPTSSTIILTNAIVDQPASVTYDYGAAVWYTPTGLFPSKVELSVPADLVLISGGAVSTVTANIQAGDQWVSMTLQVEEWLDNV